MKKYIEIPYKEYLLRGFHHQVGSDACLVMLHGFTGNCNENGRFTGISNLAEELHIDSIRVDFLCHGESDLPFEDLYFPTLVDEGKRIIEYTKELGYKDIYLLGYSMGGLTALHLLDQDIEKLILMSPAFGFPKNMKLRYDEANKTNDGHAIYGHRLLSKRFVESLDVVETMKFQKTFDKKILLVMGSDDQVIDVEKARRQMKTFQSITIKEIDNCGHVYPTIESRIELNQAIHDYLLE